MKTTRLAHLLAAAILFAAPTLCSADSTVSVDLQIKGGPAPSGLRVPPAGTYIFSLRLNQASVVLPDGTVRIIDFQKKIVATLNPSLKTFYQQGLGQFLRQGDQVAVQLSSRYEAKEKFAYEPAQGLENRPILGQSAAPYSLDLEVLLTRLAGGSQGLHMRGRRGAGGTGVQPETQGGIPGAPNPNQVQPLSLGATIGGEVWVATFVPDGCDPVQLSTVELCAFMPGLPGLRNLADRLRLTKSTLLASDISISILDGVGVAPASPPIVSSEIMSITLTHVDPSLFLIPADFLKVDPPSFALGV